MTLASTLNRRPDPASPALEESDLNIWQNDHIARQRLDVYKAWALAPRFRAVLRSFPVHPVLRCILLEESACPTPQRVWIQLWMG